MVIGRLEIVEVVWCWWFSHPEKIKAEGMCEGKGSYKVPNTIE